MTISNLFVRPKNGGSDIHSELSSTDWRHLEHLIIVAGHAVYVSPDYANYVEEEGFDLQRITLQLISKTKGRGIWSHFRKVNNAHLLST